MIDALLERLHAEGVRNDSSVTDRQRMMFNVTPSTGHFLDLLITDAAPARILELGTSNGYSTIWIARAAARLAATVDTVDASPEKTAAATSNLLEAGLQATVRLHTCDAGEYLAKAASSSFDFVFLDCSRLAYADLGS